MPIDLGHNILFYEGDPIELVAGRRRFLDVLWLPCPLAELNPEQIRTINRFRETRISNDKQFGYASSARQAVLRVLHRLHLSRALEIGCGKFPICSDTELSRYIAIEIDEIAIDHCRKAGIEIGSVIEFSEILDRDIEIAIALYAFHFAISTSLVAFIDRCLASSGFLIFNIIVDDSINFMRTMTSLSEKFQFCEIVKDPTMASREFFIVMARSSNFKIASEAARCLRHAIANG